MSDLQRCYWCNRLTAIVARATSMGVTRFFCAGPVPGSCWDELRAAVTKGTHTGMGDHIEAVHTV